MRTCSLFLLLTLLLVGSASAADFVASVKSAEGAAQILREGRALAAAPGDHVLRGDVLHTDDGRMAVLFRDDTALSLGPDTEIAVSEFLFAPHEGNLDFLLKMSKGSAAFVTGQLGKIRPEAFRVETPQATIGIRGTRFVVNVN